MGKTGARVLDLGCGDGSLMCFLRDARNVRGYGVEIDDANILACFNNGVNVIQSVWSRVCKVSNRIPSIM